MSLIGKVFEIIEDDEELHAQFPEMVPGVVFKVVSIDEDHPDGITAVQIRNGKYLHINSIDSWFWCFYCADTMRLIKEIEELASDFFPEAPTNLFDGRPIVERLTELAENFDAEYNYYEGNLIRATMGYIEQLEKRIKFSDRAF